ncbi:MAG: hypothetical protein GY702_25015 [Desulfobulbaceae bacterium]|nr:hypothetical protein [Desulfobulbaceae bacterium]
MQICILCVLGQGIRSSIVTPQVDVRSNVGIGLYLSQDIAFAATETYTISWSLYLPYDKLQLRQIPAPRKDCPPSHQQCVREYELLVKEINLCNRYITQVEDNVRDMNNIIKQFTKQKRIQERGLFDLGGSVLNTLFGMATSAELHSLHEEIYINAEIIKELNADMKTNHDSLNEKMSAHSARVNLIWKSLNSSHLEIVNVRNNLMKFRNEVSQTTDLLNHALTGVHQLTYFQQLRVSTENRHLEILKLL